MLPISSALQEILNILSRDGRVIVIAPTGSGKTTAVPQAILDAGLAGDGKVIVVQPRRVAARAAARFVAGQRGTPVGDEVGYWVRFDNCSSAGTRLTYATEGILLHLFQENPELKGVGALVFDEFHERTVMGDAALALAKALQSGPRPDLRLVVMSATLNVATISQYLMAEPVIIRGREFPVKIWHVPEMSILDIMKRIEEMGIPGDVLIFQPGKAEIEACIRELQSIEGLYVLPLHGELPDEEQDRVFAPAPLGTRKVAVATNVAETSVTVPGIVFVIDTGTEKIEEYDHRTGIGGLFLRPISRTSAEQRAGRAGRTAPGVCFRLWSEEEHQERPLVRTPEIRRVSLSGVVLLLKSLGVRDVASLDFLDHPGTERIRAAEETLRALGALDAQGNLTPIGHQMQALPVEPHLGRMLVEASRLGCVSECCTLAALASVRNIFLRPKGKEAEADLAQASFHRAGQEGGSDYLSMLAAYDAAQQTGFDRAFCDEHFLSRKSLIEAKKIRDQLASVLQRAGVQFNQTPAPAETVRRAIAAGYVDSLWRRTWGGYYRRNNQEAKIARESVLAYSQPGWVVAGEVRQVTTGKGTLNLITRATAADPAWLCQIAPHLVDVRYEHHQVETLPDEKGRTRLQVTAVEVTLLHGVEIARQRVPYAGPDAVRVLAEAIANRRVSCEATKRLGEVLDEITTLRHRDPVRLPNLPAEAVADWYEARLRGAVTVSVDDVPVPTDADVSALLGLDWPTTRETIRTQYPDRIVVRGHEVRIAYNAYDEHNALVSVPPEIVDTLTLDDLPALPGCSVSFESDGVLADTPDALRVEVARKVRRVILPRDLENMKLLSPVVVTHPDGRQETVGWLALQMCYGEVLLAKPLGTPEEAEKSTRRALAEALVRTLAKAMAGEFPPRLADLVARLSRDAAQQIVEQLDLRQLNASAWAGLVETMIGSDPASSLADRYRDLNKRLEAAERRLSSLHELVDTNLQDEFYHAELLLLTGNLDEAAAAIDMLENMLDEVGRS